MSKQEREEIIAIIMLSKNYAEEMLRNMSYEELVKTLDE
ncbi:BH0509 family protein [Lysinibacillus sp. FSL W8-0992]